MRLGIRRFGTWRRAGAFLCVLLTLFSAGYAIASALDTAAHALGIPHLPDQVANFFDLVDSEDDHAAGHEPANDENQGQIPHTHFSDGSAPVRLEPTMTVVMVSFVSSETSMFEASCPSAISYPGPDRPPKPAEPCI